MGVLVKLKIDTIIPEYKRTKIPLSRLKVHPSRLWQSKQRWTGVLSKKHATSFSVAPRLGRSAFADLVPEEPSNPDDS